MDNLKSGVSIIIVTWNGLALLKKTLDQVVLSAQSFSGPSEIIVVDNGSQDRTVDVLADFYPDIKVIKLEKNLGFSKGNNLGVKSAAFDKLLFLNNDVYISADFVSIMAKEFSSHSGAFSLCAQTNHWRNGELTDEVFSTSIGFDLSSGEIIQCFGVHNGKSSVGEVVETIYGTGAAIIVDHLKFCSLGGFPEIYSPAYWEDSDLCFQAWRKGWPSLFSSKAIAWHMVSATSEKIENSFKENLMLRNYYIFNILNFSSKRYLWRFLKKSFWFSLENLLQGNSKGSIFFKVLFGNYSFLRRERKQRQKVRVLSDSEILRRTQVNSPCYRSPTQFNSNRETVLNLLKDEI